MCIQPLVFNPPLNYQSNEPLKCLSDHGVSSVAWFCPPLMNLHYHLFYFFLQTTQKLSTTKKPGKSTLWSPSVSPVSHNSPGLPVVEIATVIAPYQATGPEQLSLKPGQYIQVRKKSNSGWWEGELQVGAFEVRDQRTRLTRGWCSRRVAKNDASAGSPPTMSSWRRPAHATRQTPPTSRSLLFPFRQVPSLLPPPSLTDSLPLSLSACRTVAAPLPSACHSPPPPLQVGPSPLAPPLAPPSLIGLLVLQSNRWRHCTTTRPSGTMSWPFPRVESSMFWTRTTPTGGKESSMVQPASSLPTTLHLSRRMQPPSHVSLHFLSRSLFWVIWASKLAALTGLKNWSYSRMRWQKTDSIL